jgi:serine/threonine protein kinase
MRPAMTCSMRRRNGTERNGLDEHSIKVVIYRMLTALKYLHSIGLVHCDVKPENILLLRAGSPQSAVLADFDYARPVAGMPAGGEFLGSRCYTSPEAWRGEGTAPPLDAMRKGGKRIGAGFRARPWAIESHCKMTHGQNIQRRLKGDLLATALASVTSTDISTSNRHLECRLDSIRIPNQDAGDATQPAPRLEKQDDKRFPRPMERILSVGRERKICAIRSPMYC